MLGVEVQDRAELYTKLWEHYDKDKSGYLDETEIKPLLVTHPLPLTPRPSLSQSPLTLCRGVTKLPVRLDRMPRGHNCAVENREAERAEEVERAEVCSR